MSNQVPSLNVNTNKAWSEKELSDIRIAKKTSRYQRKSIFKIQ